MVNQTSIFDKPPLKEVRGPIKEPDVSKYSFKIKYLPKEKLWIVKCKQFPGMFHKSEAGPLTTLTGLFMKLRVKIQDMVLFGDKVPIVPGEMNENGT